MKDLDQFHAAILVNPKAGKGQSLQLAEEAQSIFRSQNLYAEIFHSEYKEHLTELAKKCVEQKWKKVIAVGGDGTINTVVNAFFEKGIPIASKLPCLGVIPGGSGCDYFRSIQLADTSSRLLRWQDILKKNKTISVDLGMANDWVFLNMAGIGMSAEIVEKKNKNPVWVPSSLAYVFPTLHQLATHKPTRVTVITPENEYKNIDLMAMLVNKGKYAGGGMKFGPNAELNNGLFEITIINYAPWIERFAKLVQVIRGDIANQNFIHRFSTVSATIRSDSELALEIDGERVFPSRELKFKLLPNAISLCI